MYCPQSTHPHFNMLIPSFLSLLSAVLKYSFMSIFSCTVIAALMSWLNSKHGHFDFEQEPEATVPELGHEEDEDTS